VLKTSLLWRQRVAERTAPIMFGLSLLFLAIVAAMVVLWVDVPRVSELAFTGEHDSGAAEASSRSVSPWLSSRDALRAGSHCLTLLLLMWPVFLMEFAYQYFTRDRGEPFWRNRYHALIGSLCPPLRLCARNQDMGGRIWLPRLGWQVVDRSLRLQLERAFSVPMIIIALGILPVLLVEVGMREQVAARPWLQFLLHVSLGVIWFAFAAEFIVMVSVAERKMRYCKEHWLDIAIILLPLISFLRSLRIVRATRMARLARVQRLTQMSRVYRLRGLAMRALRALFLLQLINRLFRVRPEKQLRQLREILREKEYEVETLREEIAKLERIVAAAELKPPARPDARRAEGGRIETSLAE
jgi:hypothetical protein